MRVLDDELRGDIDGIVGKYPNSRSAALPLLFLVQSVEGYVSEDGMKDVADILGLTSAQVLATASFYTMLKKRPQGEYLVSVCRNISCTHLGARGLIAALQERLGVAEGETTEDGRFTLETAECLATCNGAPSLQINYEDFLFVTPEDAIALVDQLAGGQSVRSVRGETVKTAREIAREIATAGMRLPEAGVEEARTVGGESPRADTAPGFRPRVEGHGEDG
ncbi:MAG: NAD(P)H-dependent oxidoreductase subunit E [Actinomycetota bacterium]|nr:NAD(P)H-dependent oxidoreductase subunit E [Actinomycetota bacterium]